MAAPREQRQPWYAGGLRFECTGCHGCCRGGHEGVVYATEHELGRMAEHLGMTPAAFDRKYVRRVDGHETIRLTDDGDCALWKDGCTVYPERPRQCRTYPFWPEHLRSAKAWDREAKQCEGMGRGEMHDLVEIRAVLRSRGRE
ncbi:MAG: YkgJ family cysteine cluster protein [Anaeromyxobacter sp.]